MRPIAAPTPSRVSRIAIMRGTMGLGTKNEYDKSASPSTATVEPPKALCAGPEDDPRVPGGDGYSPADMFPPGPLGALNLLFSLHRQSSVSQTEGGREEDWWSAFGDGQRSGWPRCRRPR